MFSHIQKMDKVLAFAAILLAVFGIVELVAMAYGHRISVTQEYKQIAAVGIGVMAMTAISLLDYRFFKNNSYAVMLLYGIAVFFLGILLVVGHRARGLTGAFKIGEFAFAPVEMIKVVIALLLAKYFSVRHVEIYRWFHVIISFVYVAVPAGFVLLQPDLGSALVVFGLWIGILFFARISKRQVALLLIAALLFGGVSWVYFLKGYQKERIATFVNPYNDPQGIGYNAIQSMIAVGSGGMFGKGLGYGSQVQLGFLPEAHTDFMFASVAEEFGFVGIFVIFLLLVTIFWRITRIALAAENNFARLFCAGMIILILIEFIINMGMNVGIMPVIGIPFPFLSYGGSSVLMLFLGIGIVQSIKVRNAQ